MKHRCALAAVHVCVLAYAGCGGAPAPSAAPGPNESGMVVLRAERATMDRGGAPPAGPAKAAVAGPAYARIKLHYDLGGRTFPLPLVHGAIGGEPTWMLVDTGANSHVIAGWLARKAKLDAKNFGDQGTDHAGHAITTSRVDRTQMTLDGWSALPETPTLVTEIPEAVARIGIGAFLSPQQLAYDSALVLDLARAEMYTADSAQAAADLEGKGANPFTAAARACEDRDSPIRGLAFVVPAMVDSVRVSLLLDTGAHRSDLLAHTPAGRRLLPRSVPNREQVYAASGKISTRTVRGAKVSVGAYTTVTDVDILPGESDSSCPRDGVLAMDILRSCIVVFDRSTLTGRCDPALRTPRSGAGK
ncbi:aspartyl protease family protein [Pendulispora albinea]|uniref:Aspartyl protease family protein n=1 Tax=Pendulispora albinea TaxID=2741071 RepID=A0ABZ2LU74_9BACT